MLDKVLEHWPIILFGLTAIGWFIREYRNYYIRQAKIDKEIQDGDKAHRDILDMIDSLKDELDHESRARREGDQALASDMDELNARLRERFVSEEKHDLSVKRIENKIANVDEKVGANSERTQRIESKIDDLPERIATAIKQS